MMSQLARRMAPLLAALLFPLSGCERVNHLLAASTESEAAQSPAAFSAPQGDFAHRARVFRVPASIPLSHNRFVARVDAAQTVDMAFEVSGTLTELPIREGQTVPRGALIARLKQTDFLLAVEEAEVALRLKRSDHQRKASLLARRGIAQSDVDDALAAAELAQVKLKQAQESLRESTLLAPFDAYIAQRRVDNHSNIQNAVPVVRLFDLSKLHLHAEVPEALLATMSEKDVSAITASFGFVPDREFPVRYLEHRGEAGKVAQTYEVTFELEPPSDLNLLPGMTAIIHLERHSARDTAQTVEIPSSALATNPDNVLGVWVLSETTGKVHWQGVTAEASAAGKFRILQGLRGNELIVTTGVALLRNNMHIIALPDEPQGASD